jgi:hypothetical protein
MGPANLGNLTMRTRLILPLCAAFTLAACGSSSEDEAAGGDAVTADEMAAEADELPSPQAGQYRTTMELIEFNVPDAPPEMAEMLQQGFGQGPQQGSTYCITPEQAAAPTSREDMLKNMADGNCTVSRFAVAGGQIDAALSCSGDGTMNGEVLLNGTMTETSSNMEMSFTMQIPQAGQATMKMRMVSERIGECS